MNKKWLIGLTLVCALTACGTENSQNVVPDNADDAEDAVESVADTEIDLEQFRTDYIGDNTKVVGIASNQKYPEGYSYESIELQTEQYPYELKVFLKKDANAKAIYKELDENAEEAFDLIGNMDMLTYMVGDDSIVAQYVKDENGNVQATPYNYSSVIDRVVQKYNEQGMEPLPWSNTVELEEHADAIINMAEDSTGRYKVYGIMSKEEGCYGLILNDTVDGMDNWNYAYVRWYYSAVETVKPSLEYKGETLYLTYQVPDGDSYKDVTAEILCGFDTGHMELKTE